MSVVSHNPYAALGNDPEYDSDREQPPVKVKENPTARSGKRNAPAEAPAAKGTSAQAERGNNRRGGMGGSDGAYRDRNAGSANNRGKPTEGREENRHDRQGARGPRGDYGGGGRATTRPYDRHSRGVGGESEKQAAHGWGANEGNAELADETAGEAIAQAEQKDALVNDGDATAEGAAEAEPEDNSISYTEYLAQLAEKKLALGGNTLDIRKANEGSKQDKKWANAKEIAREEDEDFISGPGAKAKRDRERKQKQVVDINHEFVEQPDRGRGGFRGGRGRGDGNFRGRGEFRGGRGGEGRGRGGGRGGGGDRGSYRGGARGASLNTEDKSAFPTLGS